VYFFGNEGDLLCLLLLDWSSEGSSGGLLDDSDSDGGSHVSDSESSERRILLVGLNTERLGWDEVDDCRVSVLDGFWVVLFLLSGTSVDLVEDFSELASNVGGVAIEDWGVSGSDLSRVVHDDNLSLEDGNSGRWVVLGVSSDITTSDLLDGDVLDVESDVVSRGSLWDGLVVHFDGLDFSGESDWSEDDGHSWFHDTSFDTSDWNSSDTSDLVDVLEGNSEWLIGWSLWWGDSVESFEEGWSGPPGHVWGLLNHVVSVPSGDWDEWDGLWLVSGLLEESGSLLLDFLVTSLGIVDGFVVHLVDCDDHLLDSESVGEECVFSGLSGLGDTSFELSGSGCNDEHRNISLGGSGDHILDEISVSGSVDNGEGELLGLELPESNVDGDTSFSLSFELVEDPSILEGSLSHLSGLLLELLDCSLIDTSALVDQVSSGGGLSCVDVSNDDDVDMNFILSHLRF